MRVAFAPSAGTQFFAQDHPVMRQPIVSFCNANAIVEPTSLYGLPFSLKFRFAGTTT